MSGCLDVVKLASTHSRRSGTSFLDTDETSSILQELRWEAKGGRESLKLMKMIIRGKAVYQSVSRVRLHIQVTNTHSFQRVYMLLVLSFSE